jgi:hypothetical protein
MKTTPTLIQRILLLFALKKTQIDKPEGIATDYKKIGKTVYIIKQRNI